MAVIAPFLSPLSLIPSVPFRGGPERSGLRAAHPEGLALTARTAAGPSEPGKGGRTNGPGSWWPVVGIRPGPFSSSPCRAVRAGLRRPFRAAQTGAARKPGAAAGAGPRRPLLARNPVWMMPARAFADDIRPRYRMRASQARARCATRRAASDNAPLMSEATGPRRSFHLPGGYPAIRRRAAARSVSDRVDGGSPRFTSQSRFTTRSGIISKWRAFRVATA
jgi:hypothetical protein